MGIVAEKLGKVEIVGIGIDGIFEFDWDEFVEFGMAVENKLLDFDMEWIDRRLWKIWTFFGQSLFSLRLYIIISTIGKLIIIKCANGIFIDSDKI